MKIKDELEDNCMNIIYSLKSQYLPHAQDDESRTFFSMMIGDYYRYIAESAG